MMGAPLLLVIDWKSVLTQVSYLYSFVSIVMHVGMYAS